MPGSGFSFHNVRLPVRIEAHVNAAPITTLQGRKGPAAEVSDGMGEGRRDVRWAAQEGQGDAPGYPTAIWLHTSTGGQHRVAAL